MKLILKLLTIIYTIIFIAIFTALLIICIAYNSLKPDSLMKSLGKVKYSSIKIKDFKSDNLDKKYGEESNLTDLLIEEYTDEHLKKEDAIKLLNSDIYKKMFFESVYTNLITGNPKEYSEVEVKEKLSSFNIKNLDYKKTSEIIKTKASEVKIKKYADTKIYGEIVKRITDVNYYLIVFTLLSFIILAIFTLSMSRPLQLVGYPAIIIGTISICLSILSEMIISKLMNPACKYIVAPIFKSSLLIYGIIALAFGAILAIIYEFASHKTPDNDKDLYSLTNISQDDTDAHEEVSSPNAAVVPTENINIVNDQIS